MYRSFALCGALVASACVAEPEPSLDAVSQEAGRPISGLVREHIAGDVWHHRVDVRVGDGPNAVLRMHRVVRERAPGIPRATSNGIMLLHGDFSTFPTNFAPGLGTPASSEPGLAVYLAEQGVDVWGFDRRWASAPADADLSDFAEMGLAQELDDVGRALAFARGVRLLTGSGLDRMILSGFSRGGQLAYLAASLDAARPAPLRHVKGLAILDVYGEIAPEDDVLRQGVCVSAGYERADLDAGIVDSPNALFIDIGTLALADPAAPSPIFDGFTNLGLMYWVAGQTYNFFPATPVYHLLGTELDADGNSVALRFTPDAVGATWYAGASPHQALREATESDELWCREVPPAVDAPLSRIRVPLFYLGAAGGYGDHGLYATTRVASTDVTSLVVRRLDPAEEAEDFGHGDLLFASDAETLAWAPLASWISAR